MNTNTQTKYVGGKTARDILSNPEAQDWNVFIFSLSDLMADTLHLSPPNLKLIRMMKYSASAKIMKMMLMKIQRMRGQMPSDLGIICEILLFMLIIMRRRVRSRPRRPGTTSKLTAKLIQLVMTITKQGAK